MSGLGVRHAGPVRRGDELICDECGNLIDPAGPGVTSSGDSDPWWQPFLEDLRADPQEHRHPRCFADARGVDALIEAVHREDLRRQR